MNNFHKDRMDWLKKNYESKFQGKYDVKFVSEEQGDLGGLEGIQFESEKQGGYIYFWSSKYIGYQLVDYEIGEEVIEDTTKEVEESSLENELNNLLQKI